VEVRQLANKVKVTASTDLDRHYPKYWSGRVTVRLAGGQSVTHEVTIPKGESGNPMSQDEVEENFYPWRRRYLAPKKHVRLCGKFVRWLYAILWRPCSRR
jgi:2-methylcitrate dehydratase PrpD